MTPESLASWVTIVGIIATLASAAGALISTYITSRSETKRMRIEETRAPADVANLNVNAAAQVAGISLQQTSLLANLVNECTTSKRQLEDENRVLLARVSDLRLLLRQVASNLRELLIDHNEKSQEVQCGFSALLQRGIERIIADIERNDTTPNG